MILIDSLYINNSGGKVLLEYLVEKLEIRNINSYYLFDLRCINDFENIPHQRKIFLKANIKNRNNFYKQNLNRFSAIFCFGNIPPPFKVNIPVYTYFHNVSLVETPSNYGIKERILKYIKRLYIKQLTKNTTYFIVQTSFVKIQVCSKLNFNQSQCIILPFFKSLKNKIYTKKHPGSFLYVSNGNTHKNHNNLLRAWNILAKNEIYPELHLTITSNHTSLLKNIDFLKTKGVKIFNHGFTDPTNLYKRSEYVIYPSLTESFGLGLIEGIEYNCNIVAADKPYVYQVVKPTLVFDPTSVESIADTVSNIIKEPQKYPQSLAIIENKIDELINLISNETNNTRP